MRFYALKFVLMNTEFFLNKDKNTIQIYNRIMCFDTVMSAGIKDVSYIPES